MVDRSFTQDEFSNLNQSVKKEQTFGLTAEGKVATRVIVDDIIDPLALEESLRVKNIPKITNLSINDTDEHSHTFQDNVKAFSIRCRSASRMNISYIQNQTNTKFLTNGLGGVYREENIKPTNGFKIYFRLEKANRIVEILEWT